VDKHLSTARLLPILPLKILSEESLGERSIVIFKQREDGKLNGELLDGHERREL